MQTPSYDSKCKQCLVQRHEALIYWPIKPSCASKTLMLSFAHAGVAAGSTRAALTLHFAKQNNAADISAKEGTQVKTCPLSVSKHYSALADLGDCVCRRLQQHSLECCLAWPSPILPMVSYCDNFIRLCMQNKDGVDSACWSSCLCPITDVNSKAGNTEKSAKA